MSGSLRVMAVSVLGLVAASRAAGAAVTVVDLASPAPVLQSAVDAAASGDILLLKPGAIDGGSTITIDGKGLTLVADGDPVQIGRLIVQNLPAGGQVTLRGLTVGKPGLTGELTHTGAIEVRACAGSVWIEDCVASAPPSYGGSFGFGFTGVSGALIVNSAAVVLVKSRFTGGRGGPESPSCVAPGYAPPTPGGEGLRVVGSVVAMHAGQSTGGEGGNDSFGQCQPGFTAE